MNAQHQKGKQVWRKVDGVLLLDKSLGLSSNRALQSARRLYNAEKAGHTGTLDPLATGLLPLCFGEATKFSGELLNADKRYIGTVQLGVTTDTADAEGSVLERRPVDVSLLDVKAALGAFVGEFDQIPPMYSALKRDGKPLYEYARAGIEVERAPRRVTIYESRLLEEEFNLETGRFVFEIRCSKGTYVRTLAADIGERLGCGAHLVALRRTGIGKLGVEQAHSLATLEDLTAEQRDELLLAPDSLLSDLSSAHLDAADAVRLRQGQAVRWSGEADTRLRVYDPDHHFMGVCKLVADGWLQPLRLVSSS
ncbi:MAG: tRNA pseudouridine(55) synthase TruB [Burkholderiaceae bacterium]|nr:tRNA pseudouridine(55) synthase TruB [Sulfuritalea sp.]MCF8174887.1 tRNA pseudouridine(55) synthase TruB [Burkholderiaceae bacterium]MCF8184776.1 tRNA pseudouridine(55) synthase TruB [Polynucleobacter sp.]